MPQRLATTLTAQGERHLRSHHPWIYTDSIQRMKGKGEPGDLCIFFDRRRDKFLGIGLYDPDSPIRIKVIYVGPPIQVNADFFNALIAKSFVLRAPLLHTDTDSYRLINGENDGFPGLIADIYGKVLVVKLYSRIWIPWFADFQQELLAVSGCDTLVLRLSRKLTESTNLPPNWSDGAIIHGELASPEVVFREHGVSFTANVLEGHKTGFFLDHRDNRRRVGELAKGRKVLDVFSYAGGFAVHALVGGAAEVTALDISKQALQLAHANAELNGVADRLNTLQGDAFAELEALLKSNQKFDLIIIDPPSFAKKATEVEGAMRAYARLTRIAVPLVAEGGILLLASCSARISAEDFYALQTSELQKSRRTFTELARTGHDIDHSICFSEGAYLKAIYVQL